MSAPQKFRTALNGFNREDVAGYLEYINSRHNAQVSQLTSEAEFLRTKLENMGSGDDQRAVISALEQERNDLQTLVEALQLRCAALEEELQAARSNAAAPAAIPAAMAMTSAEELEIYRRAERTERMARERADLIYRQTNGVLSEASVRVSEMAEQVVPIADQILLQIGQLQNAVNTTRQSLQDAVIIMNTLRSDNN